MAKKKEIKEAEDLFDSAEKAHGSDVNEEEKE